MKSEGRKMKGIKEGAWKRAHMPTHTHTHSFPLDFVGIKFLNNDILNSRRIQEF